jgi:hypothetical protein
MPGLRRDLGAAVHLLLEMRRGQDLAVCYLHKVRPH